VSRLAYTIDQAAAALDVSTGYIEQAIVGGNLYTVTLDGKRLIPRPALKAWLTRHAPGGARGVPEWSVVVTVSKLAKLFRTNAKTMRRFLQTGTVHNRCLGRQSYLVDLRDVPAHCRAKLQPPTT
jgi:excisionase family DNA binding protein